MTQTQNTAALRAEYNQIQERIAMIFGSLNSNHYVAPSDDLIARKQELERILGINQD